MEVKVVTMVDNPSMEVANPNMGVSKVNMDNRVAIHINNKTSNNNITTKALLKDINKTHTNSHHLTEEDMVLHINNHPLINNTVDTDSPLLQILIIAVMDHLLEGNIMVKWVRISVQLGQRLYHRM